MSSKRATTAARSRHAYAPIFAALGDETRLSIVTKLCHETTQSIAQLTEGEKITRQAITKHLRVLEGAGLIRSARTGRETHITLVPEPLNTATEYLRRVSVQWDEALARLKLFVEK